MPWGRCDDKYWRHVKTLNLAERYRAEAIALYWMAISWSNDVLADGLVSMATVRMLGFTKQAAAELQRVGLWEAASGGSYHVHDYLDFNKSRAQVLAERQKWAAEKAGQRGKSTAESGADSIPDSIVDSIVDSIADSDVESTADSRARVTRVARVRRDAAAPRSPVSPVLPYESRDSRVPSARAKGQSGHDDAARAWLTDHSIELRPSTTASEELDRLVGIHGANTVVAAMARLGQLNDANQYVFGARNALDPIPSATGATSSPNGAESTSDARYQATQRRLREEVERRARIVAADKAKAASLEDALG